MSTTGNLDGHLGDGTEIDGTLQFKGSVRIDGKFTGKVFSPATLILGPRASLQGEVEVGELEVHGALKGQVRAAERVTIHASGKVEADVDTDKLVIEPGAYFRGRCEMRRGSPAGGVPADAKPATKPAAKQASAAAPATEASAQAGTPTTPQPARK